MAIGAELVRRFAEEYALEPEHITGVRATAAELGIVALTPAAGAQLAAIAASSGAGSVLEVGTGTGVAALWVLHGAPEAQLTSIDFEPEHHRVAREALARAPKARLITGRALDVLPRMNEASYDLVLLHAEPGPLLDYLEHALRLVRAGGSIVITGVLRGGKVADAVARDEHTVMVRELLAALQAGDDVVVALSTAGDGLLQLVRR